MKRTAAAVVLAVAVAAALSCSAPVRDDGAVRIAGSDTMLVLLRRLAVEFMTARPGTTVVVDGGGTGAGVEALINGDTDLCAASRPLAADEVQRMFERFRTIGARAVIGKDALSVWVHPDNPVRSVSMAQLRALFGGELATWSQVGGMDEAVVPVIRPPSSGTFRFFRDHVLRGEAYATTARTVPTTRAVVEAVAGNRRAIGYGGVAYRSAEVVALAVDGVEPTLAAVRGGGYPLVRYLQLYSVDQPEGAVRAFVDFCLGSEGQRIVLEVGYVPGWER